MKYIQHADIQAGDVVAWAYDPSITHRASIIYYEVESVDHQDQYTTIVYGKSFGAGGERYANVDRKWDMVPYDRDLLLISREDNEPNIK